MRAALLGFIKKQASPLTFAGIVLVLCAMPVLHALGILHSASIVIFLGKCTAYAILAIGLDLLWGYAGVLSLGHGLFFGLGGYAMAMYLKLQETGGGITQFMQTGGYTELPLIWVPFLNLPLSLVLIVLVPGLIAGVLGFFIFKNRIKGVFFTIISQALTWATMSLFIALSPITNGNTGITEITPLVGSIRGAKNLDHLLLLSFVAIALLVAVFAIATLLTRSKYGKLLLAIRDGENRTYFSGYPVVRYKNFTYIVSAVFAAIAGALFVNFNGSIAPNQMAISFSILMVVWVAIGGRGTLIGAVLGAFLINLADYNFNSGAMVGVWPYILGGLFVLTILFFRGGLVGLVTEQIPAGIRKCKKLLQELREHGALSSDQTEGR
jgi:urea transport system permease protein